MKLEISLLEERELLTAEKLLRLSFGTFLGLKKPMDFGDGAEYTSRWYREPLGVFVAKAEGKLIGFSMVANWGSCGGFGPLVTHPDYWDRGIASQLIDASWSKFDEWGSQQIIFCTHANSPKHIHLYGKFGAEPRFLIALCTKAISSTQWKTLKAKRYSQLDSDTQAVSLNAAYKLTDEIYEGLDWRKEILLVEKRALGDTLLVWDDRGLIGLAICHYGMGSEAARGSCYLKLGAAKGVEAFEELIEQCEALTGMLGMSSLVAGVDTACVNAYHFLIARKFRRSMFSVSMHKPNRAGYSRRDVYLIEDRR